MQDELPLEHHQQYPPKPDNLMFVVVGHDSRFGRYIIRSECGEYLRRTRSVNRARVSVDEAAIIVAKSNLKPRIMRVEKAIAKELFGQFD